MILFLKKKIALLTLVPEIETMLPKVMNPKINDWKRHIPSMAALPNEMDLECPYQLSRSVPGASKESNGKERNLPSEC